MDSLYLILTNGLSMSKNDLYCF